MGTTHPLEIDVDALADRLATAYVIDVRNLAEYMAGHVPGAVPMPADSVPGRLVDLPRDRTVHVICTGGSRSRDVARTLAVAGIDALSVTGGTTAWIRAGLPVSTGRAAA
jgi:rhodanese-related sulfurtransferase